MVRRLMEHGLRAKESTSPFTPNRVEHYRVVPLKLALKQLELKLSQASSVVVITLATFGRELDFSGFQFSSLRMKRRFSFPG